jgi:uncharacterized OB-fold protein
MVEGRPIRPGLFVDDADGPHLLASRCGACGRLQFPAGTVCPYCAATGCVDARLGPAGRLRLFTAVQTSPPGYRGPVPYGFGVVDVDGLSVVTRLTEARPERLRPGLPMTLVLEPVATDDDGRPVLAYAFRPAGGA